MTASLLETTWRRCQQSIKTAYEHVTLESLNVHVADIGEIRCGFAGGQLGSEARLSADSPGEGTPHRGCLNGGGGVRPTRCEKCRTSAWSRVERLVEIGT